MTAGPVHRIALGASSPVLGDGAWVAPGVSLIGAVTLGADSSVWYGAVLRADGDRIEVGVGSNIQDGCVLHADPDLPVRVGTGVSVGHRAVLHGCEVEGGVLIGMGALVLNGARIGTGSIVAAGTVVLEGTTIPPGSLVAGVPGRVRRETTDEERASINDNARRYLATARRHRLGVDA